MAQWIVVIQWLSRLVLLILFGLSIWSVQIMLGRYRIFKILVKSQDFEAAKGLILSKQWSELKEWSESLSGLAAGSIRAALSVDAAHPEAIDRSVKSYLLEQKSLLERGFTVLATLGSNAPFIGLFGTVLGIIQAFGELSQSQVGATSVMSGISEALVATAIGLFVAIPAVVGYNVFSRQLKLLLTESEILRDLYVSRKLGQHGH